MFYMFTIRVIYMVNMLRLTPWGLLAALRFGLRRDALWAYLASAKSTARDEHHALTSYMHLLIC